MFDVDFIRSTSKYLIKRTINIALELIAVFVSVFSSPQRSKIPAIRDDILLLPAVELSKKIKKGELTSERVVRSYISQVELVNPILKAVIDPRFNQALSEARKIDQQLADARNDTGDQSILLKPLVGVPVTIKETLALEGGSYTCGFPRWRLRKSSKNGQAVAKLLEAGLVPIALTNIPCMNIWWDSYNLLHGRTKNPYDLSRIPGGSTGGEASILGAAGSVVGIGSDLAGSIRIPANFCGVFGHKPTPFCVSNEGLFAKLRGDQEKLFGVGPMARYACDLLPMLDSMVDGNKRSLLKLHEPVDLKKIKIFYCEDLECPLVSKCDTDVLSGLRAAAEHLSTNFRLPVQKVTLDEFKYGMSLWAAENEVEGGKVYDNEHKDGQAPINPISELVNCIFGRSEFPFNAIFCTLVENLLGSRFGSPKHRYLTGKAADLRKRFYEMVGDDGILLMPTHPQSAPTHHATIPKFINVSYTAVANTLQAPITQCPLGMTREGLPYGCQLIAKPYNDRVLLAVARELEKAFGGWLPPARVAH